MSTKNNRIPVLSKEIAAETTDAVSNRMGDCSILYPDNRLDPQKGRLPNLLG